MVERVVSVKMPRTLIEGLRELQAKHHYLDLSEQLRSVVRARCLEMSNPYTAEIKRLRHDLSQESPTTTSREQIIKELIELLKEGER